MADKVTLDRIKAAKSDHDLHVLLLMKQQGLSKGQAMVLAYCDGVLGLADRLASPVQSPKEPAAPAKGSVG